MEKTEQIPIRILIVDDDLDVIADIIKSFKSFNEPFKSTVCNTPEEALTLIKSERFDLLLIDYAYTGSKINGLDVFEAIKKAYIDHVYIGLMVVGCGTTGLFVSEQAAGLFADYIEKPFHNAVGSLAEKIGKAKALLARRRETGRQEPGI